MHPTHILSLFTLATGVFASWQSLGIPASSTGATLSVQAFNVGNLTIGTATQIVHPVVPGHEIATVPVFAFLLKHTAAGGRTTRQFMWDIGIRKDLQNAVPSVAAEFNADPAVLQEPKDITELLVVGGVNLTSIEAVIWSHAHLDHFGDMSKWPNSTNLIVGADTDLSTYPTNPNATLQPSDLAGHNLTKIDFTKSTLTIGSLPAIDFFGDGSFYLLDSPGHLAGQMTGLARVTVSPDSFVLFAADTAHHIGVTRPRPLLARNFPCPGDVLAASRSAISTDFFWSPNSSLGSFDLSSRKSPLLGISDVPGSLYANPAQSQVTLDKLAAFDGDEDVLMVIAHDGSNVGALPVFPNNLDGWKKQGLKETLVWRFLEMGDFAFVF